MLEEVVVTGTRPQPEPWFPDPFGRDPWGLQFWIPLPRILSSRWSRVMLVPKHQWGVEATMHVVGYKLTSGDLQTIKVASIFGVPWQHQKVLLLLK